MKKRLVIAIGLTFAALASSAQTQITNGGFESWRYDGGNLPDGWNSFQTADGPYAAFAYSPQNRQVARSTDVRPGSTGKYSCRIWTREINAVIVKARAQGNLTTGRVHAGSTTATGRNNYNYSDRDGSEKHDGMSNPCAMRFTGRPKALSVWVKFSAEKPSSLARIVAFIHDDCDFVDGYAYEDYKKSEHLVASAEKRFSSAEASGWTRLVIPFEYTGSTSAPAYVLLTCSTNSEPGQGDEGDELLVDDIEMIY